MYIGFFEVALTRFPKFFRAVDGDKWNENNDGLELLERQERYYVTGFYD